MGAVEQRLAVLMEPGWSGRSVSEVCRRHGISRETFYDWQRRHDRDGLEGLVAGSRRPHRSPGQVGEALTDRILEIRKEQGWGPRKIRDRLVLDGVDPAPATSTVQQVLARHGDGALRRRRGAGPGGRDEGQRFTYAHCNELWQIDGAMHHLADGHGYWAVDIIDDHSRFCVGIELGEALTSTLAWSAMRAAVGAHGLPAGLLSDNGLCFTGRLRAVTVSFERQVARAGVRLTHSRPYNPRCCGKIERLHQTARGWLARRPAPATLAQARALFAEFAEHYNTYRPHQALDGDLPARRYRPGAPTVLPVLEVEPADAHLPDGALLREINHGGRLSYAGRKLYLDARFAGLTVGLLRDKGRLHVYYGSSRIETFSIGTTHPHPRR